MVGHQPGITDGTEEDGVVRLEDFEPVLGIIAPSRR